jgi:hypothetical protein
MKCRDCALHIFSSSLFYGHRGIVLYMFISVLRYGSEDLGAAAPEGPVVLVIWGGDRVVK